MSRATPLLLFQIHDTSNQITIGDAINNIITLYQKTNPTGQGAQRLINFKQEADRILKTIKNPSIKEWAPLILALFDSSSTRLTHLICQTLLPGKLGIHHQIHFSTFCKRSDNYLNVSIFPSGTEKILNNLLREDLKRISDFAQPLYLTYRNISITDGSDIFIINKKAVLTQLLQHLSCKVSHIETVRLKNRMEPKGYSLWARFTLLFYRPKFAARCAEESRIPTCEMTAK